MQGEADAHHRHRLFVVAESGLLRIHSSHPGGWDADDGATTLAGATFITDVVGNGLSVWQLHQSATVKQVLYSRLPTNGISVRPKSRANNPF